MPKNGCALEHVMLAKNYQIIVNGRLLSRRRANAPPRSKWSALDRVPEVCYSVLDDNRRNAWAHATTGSPCVVSSPVDVTCGYSGVDDTTAWSRNTSR